MFVDIIIIPGRSIVSAAFCLSSLHRNFSRGSVKELLVVVLMEAAMLTMTIMTRKVMMTDVHRYTHKYAYILKYVSILVIMTRWW